MEVDRLEVNKLVLRDDEGNLRAILGVADDQVALSLLDCFGEVRLSLSVSGSGTTGAQMKHAGGRLGINALIDGQGRAGVFVHAPEGDEKAKFSIIVDKEGHAGIIFGDGVHVPLEQGSNDV